MEASDKDGLSRGDGAVLWPPDEVTVRQARITRFIRWLARGPRTRDYDPASVLASDLMPDVRWFHGALRPAWTHPGRITIVFDSERACRGLLTCAELAEQVARVARGRRFRGNPRGP